MTAAYRLKPDGKPMRALRALAETTSTHPMTEHGVRVRATRNPDTIREWWGPLATLVSRGLAERSGVAGEYVWHITQEGRDLLTIEDANARVP